MDEYYVWDGKMQHGPFSLLQLQSMWQSGSITPLMLYTQPGLEEWTPLSELAESLRPPQKRAYPARPRTAPRFQPAPHLRTAPQESGNPPYWTMYVVFTIIFPIVGFAAGIKFLVGTDYRGAGGALVGIAFVMTFLYVFVLPQLLH